MSWPSEESAEAELTFLRSHRMGLKNQIVYGELSTLLGQIRQKVDFNSDGSLYE